MLYQLSYRPTLLPGFFVHSVLATKPAVLFKLNSSWMQSPVLGRRVIASATNFTFQRYLITWHSDSLGLLKYEEKSGADDQD